MMISDYSQLVAALGGRNSPAKLYGEKLRSGDPNDRDPGQGIEGLPPNIGNDVVPHVLTFQGLLRSVARVYRIDDEALQQSWENARFMRNDVGIMECLEQRKRSCALLGWHIEPEDEKSPQQKTICEELTNILENVPYFIKYREALLEALWYGKYAIQHRYRWKKVGSNLRIVPERWRPVHGDKLVFRYDDGTGEYDEDQVGIRVGQGYQLNQWMNGRWKVERANKIAATDHGLAYFLEAWERPLLAIHRHIIEDGEYEYQQHAGRIHGVGIRSRIYATWFQQQEALAWLMEFLERSAFGIELWYYPAGNPQAETKTKKAAQERIGEGRNIILVPVHPEQGNQPTSFVQRIEPSMAGAGVLKEILTDYFGHRIKRYILGQTLTSEAAATGLGSGVASIHLDTYLQIVRYDAINLQETVTRELLKPLIQWNWPGWGECPIKFVLETESPDIEGKLRAWKDAYEMGLAIPARDVANLIGANKAEEGDEVLKKQAEGQGGGPGQGGFGGGDSGQSSGFGHPGGPVPKIDPMDDMKRLMNQLGVEQYRNRKLRLRVKALKEKYRQATEAKAGKEPKAQSSGQRWVTIGGHETEEGEHAGGFPVLLDANGKVIASGAPGLQGKHVSEAGGKGKGEPKPESKPEAKAESKPDTKTVRMVKINNQDFEVQQERSGWSFRRPGDAGWVHASEGTAKAIEEAVSKNQPVKVENPESVAGKRYLDKQLRRQGSIEATKAKRQEAMKNLVRTAEDVGVSPDELNDALDYLMETEREQAAAREAAKGYARKLTGLTAGDVSRLSNAGYDHTSGRKVGGVTGERLAHWDEFAGEIAREHPELGWGDPDYPNVDLGAALWELVGEGRQALPDRYDPETLRRAADLALANRGGAGGEYEFDEAGAVPFKRVGEVERYRRWKARRDRQAGRSGLVEKFALAFAERGWDGQSSGDRSLVVPV